MPFSTAAARTKVLNVEPGCRLACERRLNWLFARPGTIAVIARIDPLAGSMEMSAAAGSFGAVSVPRIAVLRELLPARLDRRVDAQAARANGLGAVRPHELVAHVPEEVRLADLRVEPSRPRPILLAVPTGTARGVIMPSSRIATSTWSRRATACSRVGERVVRGRRLRQTCEQRCLRQRQRAGGAREVRARGCFRAVREVAVEDRVEVVRKNPVLRPLSSSFTARQASVTFRSTVRSFEM